MRAPADPSVLTLLVDAGVLRDHAGQPIASMVRVDAGEYRTMATFPAVEGPIQLFAVFEDAGLTGAATTYVDVTPPRPVVDLAAPPMRTLRVDGGYTEVDPQSPGAFRRNDRVSITIDVPDLDVVAPSISMLTAGGGLQPLGVLDAGCTSRFDGGTCWRRQVDLWRHPMNAYHDQAAFLVSVSDDLGNGTTADGGFVNITRFGWSKHAPGLIESLALTKTGELAFLTTTSTAAPNLTTWHPDGRDRWTVGSAGGDSFGRYVTVGSQADERIYVTTVDATLNRMESSATNSRTPGMAISPLFNIQAVSITSAPVILNLGGEEVLYAATQESLITPRVELHAWKRSNQAVWSVDAGIAGAFLDGLVTDGTRVFVPSFSSAGPVDVIPFTFASDGFFQEIKPRIQVPAGVVSAAVWQTDLLYLGLIGSPSGQLVPMSGTALLSPAVSVPFERPVVLAGANALFINSGAPTSGMSLCRLPAGTTLPSCVAAGSYAVPILGAAPAGGAPVLYVAAYDVPTVRSGSRIRAIDSASLTVLWETPIALGATAFAPWSIDCARGGPGVPGSPGVLYAAEGASRITAIIVDSPGVDGTARWPMLQHDPRNTSNSLTPLTDFYCP